MLEDAFFLGRALRAQGHDVKLIPTQFMKPFVKSNKSDFFGNYALFHGMVNMVIGIMCLPY